MKFCVLGSVLEVLTLSFYIKGSVFEGLCLSVINQGAMMIEVLYLCLYLSVCV